MDITSLIITFVGIIIILAIYIISRISRSKLPQAKTTRLPNLKNEDGTRFTSVLDDIPARDGSTPTAKKPPTPVKQDQKSDAQPAKQKQHILFISPNNEAGLDGNLVAKVLKKNGLLLGDMDIYHYFSESKTSLFRVANGVDPWTLTKEDLHNKELAGLSIVLLTPTEIDDADAIRLFLSTSHKLSQEMNGVLKNQLQQVFTPKDEAELLNSL
jgi:FtsZ-interacting cell division protein ZipA